MHRVQGTLEKSPVYWASSTFIITDKAGPTVRSLVRFLQHCKSHSSFRNAALYHPQLRNATSNVYSKSHLATSFLPYLLCLPHRTYWACSVQSWLELCWRPALTITTGPFCLASDTPPTPPSIRAKMNRNPLCTKSCIQSYVSSPHEMKMRPFGAHYEMPEEKKAHWWGGTGGLTTVQTKSLLFAVGRAVAWNLALKSLCNTLFWNYFLSPLQSFDKVAFFKGKKHH